MSHGATPAPRLRIRGARCRPRRTLPVPVLATAGAVRRACSASVIARYDFASPAQVFLNLFVDNAYLIVLAVGMTFVILTGGIDLSASASVVALSTVIVGHDAAGRLADAGGHRRSCWLSARCSAC